MIDFAEVRKSVERFCRKRGESSPFIVEAILRLDQLHWLVGEIQRAEGHAVEVHRQMLRADDPSDIPVEIIALQTLTESFYYLAWRLIGLLDRTDSPVRELIGLRKKCRGIRMVRNQLLEHPESRDSRVHVPAIMFGSSRGVQLKLVAEVATDSNGKLKFRTNTAELFDPGIWANALELKSAIEDAISKN